MSLFIIAEHDHQHLDGSFYRVLQAGLQIDKHPIVIVIGHSCGSVAEEAARVKGVDKVLLVEALECEHLIAEQISPIIVDLIKEGTYLLVASTTFGKNILPRIAALLEVGQVSDVTAIVNEHTFEHPIYAGNAIETIEMLDPQKLLSIRTTAFSMVSETQEPCVIQPIKAAIPICATKWIRREQTTSLRPDLSIAKIIVSGGRGLQSAEQFKLVEQLADALGAALGASRAAVDAGFISNDHQVGQTGKIVAPILYIALGISGAIQHLAGIKEAQIIVAINKDENAPIFQIANYGLVGDVFELVPQLLQELKQRGLHKC
ncbi:MAG TPA: electron transfer flavoprotein subunit alpha/FixB family protein [Legionellaceae bacterium]|nr:electron transfer flavoprotein subunit alpha/FixB family protein [Legionellaceae bacterium]